MKQSLERHDADGTDDRLIDKPGLLTTSTPLTDAQKSFARNADEWKDNKTDLQSVIEKVHPNVLIGTSTVPKSFTEPIVRAMASHCERPIIMPLSNPTRLHEAVPGDLLKWTNGKALVATGSPFKPVKGPWGRDGSEVSVEIAECNNSVVFPGIGLGSVLCRAKLVTDEMLVAAVKGVADMSPALSGKEVDETAPLLPGVEVVRDVSVRIARRVIQTAVQEGVATEKDLPTEEEELDEWIREQMWNPVYRPLKAVSMQGAGRRAMGNMKVVGSVGWLEAA
jgi:malate dehydrogenase (oxaloacetate-decarboxylating)